MLAVGDTVAPFQLQDIHGREKTLESFIATKPALITLFKVSCPVCQMTLPYLERISKSDTLEVIAISQDDLDATQAFRERFGVTFTTLLDESRKGYPVSNAFGITSVPSLFLVEPGGAIAMAGEGFSKRELESVGKLAGVEPFKPGENVPELKAG